MYLGPIWNPFHVPVDVHVDAKTIHSRNQFTDLEVMGLTLLP